MGEGWPELPQKSGPIHFWSHPMYNYLDNPVSAHPEKILDYHQIRQSQVRREHDRVRRFHEEIFPLSSLHMGFLHVATV